MKKILSCLAILLVTLSLCGCGGGGENVSAPNVRMAIALSPGNSSRGIADVTRMEIDVTSGQKALYHDVFDYSAGTSLPVNRAFYVEAGTARTFKVNALRADGTVEFTASQTVDIPSGQSVTVAMTLQAPPAGVSITGTIHDIAGPPSIEFTSVPAYGSFDNIRGRVRNVLPNDAKVVVFIYVVGRWWPKPYANTPFTPIRADGTFECDITTGGVDQLATEIRAYLVRKDYDNQLQLPPDPVTADVWAMASATRSGN